MKDELTITVVPLFRSFGLPLTRKNLHCKCLVGCGLNGKICFLVHTQILRWGGGPNLSTGIAGIKHLGDRI